MPNEALTNKDIIVSKWKILSIESVQKRLPAFKGGKNKNNSGVLSFFLIVAYSVYVAVVLSLYVDSRDYP